MQDAESLALQAAGTCGVLPNCPPPRSGGGSNSQTGTPARCNDGGEYDLIKELGRNAGANPQVSLFASNWYYIDNGNNRHELTAREEIMVGPVCCTDCCSSFCSELNPDWVCLPPIVYNSATNAPLQLKLKGVCRPAVLPFDLQNQKCQDLGGLPCLKSLQFQFPVSAGAAAGQPNVPAKNKEESQETNEETEEETTSVVQPEIGGSQESDELDSASVTGAYGGKTSIAGALVAGIILIAGLIVVAVLIANRPGKPISGSKLQTQIDSHVAVLRKLEETIGNIEKRRKP